MVVGAGNQTQVLCESSQCSALMSHLASPGHWTDSPLGFEVNRSSDPEFMAELKTPAGESEGMCWVCLLVQKSMAGDKV